MMRSLIGGLLSFFIVACNGQTPVVCKNIKMMSETTVIKTSTRLESKTRDATVEIYSDRTSGLSFGTGTLFKYKNKNIVITSAHVLGDDSNGVIVAIAGEEATAEVIYYDSENDLAVLILPELPHLQPIKLRLSKPDDVKIGQDLLFSGHPNMMGLLTIRGYVAGMYGTSQIIMHSFGWSGASGSAVFSKNGKLVGILMAIGVGPGMYGEAAHMEDIVFLVPAWKLDLELLENNM